MFHIGCNACNCWSIISALSFNTLIYNVLKNCDVNDTYDKPQTKHFKKR